MSKNIQLLGVDWQNDFCLPDGALPVPGAMEDAQKTADLIRRLGSNLYDIHLTMDSHRRLDISHPLWWIYLDGVDV